MTLEVTSFNISDSIFRSNAAENTSTAEISEPESCQPVNFYLKFNKKQKTDASMSTFLN